MLKLAALGATLLSSLAFAPAAASAATPAQTPSFTIRLLTAAGSGCPQGSIAVSGSRSEFTVTYDQYIAATGAGTSPLNFRKNCQLDTRVGIPAGWTFGVSEVDYRGYAHLGRGARGTVAASYYFAGLPGTARQSHRIRGAVDRDYEFNDRANVVTWAPCRTAVGLNIDTELRTYAGFDDSYLNLLTMDSTDVSLGTIYHLVFQRCQR
jgi:hypothetical protein